jgi:hypothetical protein
MCTETFSLITNTLSHAVIYLCSLNNRILILSEKFFGYLLKTTYCYTGNKSVSLDRLCNLYEGMDLTL